VDVKQMRPYFRGGAAPLTKMSERILLDLHSETEEPEDDFMSGASSKRCENEGASEDRDHPQRTD